jgi:hypothetical protein
VYNTCLHLLLLKHSSFSFVGGYFYRM